MRLSILTVALAVAAAQPASAQPAPQPSASAAPCVRQDVALAGGIGRASVVAFTGPVYGQRVCAIVANLAADTFTTAVSATPADDAVVSAGVSNGTGTTLESHLGGPFVIAPGGTFGDFGGDNTEVPRVLIAYAGQRVLLVRTTAVTLLDLAHALREQSAVFGSDAAERAVILASGDAATMLVRTADGTLGTTPGTPLQLALIKRR
jgi:hypothetical protein